MEYLLTKVKYFEDKESSLLGFQWNLLRYSGYLKFESRRYNILLILILLQYVVCVSLTYANIFVSWGDWTAMPNNPSLAYSQTMSFLRVFLFHWNKSKWADIIDNIKSVERSFNDKSNKKVNQVITEKREYMRKVSTVFLFIVLSTCVSMTIASVALYLSGSSSATFIVYWLPLNHQSTSCQLVTLLLQIYSSSMSGLQTSTYDTTISSIGIWFTAQLDTLRIMCREIGKPSSPPDSGEETVSESEVLRRIGKCQKFHVSILDLQRKVNALLSPVMFINLCGCSAILGATIVLLVNEQDGISQYLFRILYIICQFTELFLLYWFCNEVTVKSTEVSLGVWESAWTRYGVRVRRSCLILMMGLETQIVFTAGPYNNMTLDTFVSVLKTSYSAYAALVTMK